MKEVAVVLVIKASLPKLIPDSVYVRFMGYLMGVPDREVARTVADRINAGQNALEEQRK